MDKLAVKSATTPNGHFYDRQRLPIGQLDVIRNLGHSALDQLAVARIRQRKTLAVAATIARSLGEEGGTHSPRTLSLFYCLFTCHGVGCSDRHDNLVSQNRPGYSRRQLAACRFRSLAAAFGWSKDEEMKLGG